MSYSEQTILAVWSKAWVVPDRNPSFVRKDRNGKLIYWSQYGKRNLPFGWEIHHDIPLAKGGSDHISNLIPLYWKTNASLGGILSNR